MRSRPRPARRWLCAGSIAPRSPRSGHPVLNLPSGAGHDAMAIAAIAPIGMLFVRCRGGISHHPDEHVDDADAERRRARSLHRILHPLPGADAMTPHRTGLTSTPSSPAQPRARDGASSPSWCARPPTIRPATARAHAERAAALLEGLGFDGRAASGAGGAARRAAAWSRSPTCRAPALRRRRAGDRAQRAWRRGAAGRGLDRRSLRRGDPRRLDVRPRRRGVEIRLSPPTPSRCWRWTMRRAALRGTVELHFTYDEETGGEIGPNWLLEQGITQPDLRDLRRLLLRASSTAHNGCLHLEVEVTGRSAHAAKPCDRHRRAGGGDADPGRALRVAAVAGAARPRRSPASARRSSRSG